MRTDDARPRCNRRHRGWGGFALRLLIAAAALVPQAAVAGAATGIERRVLDHVDRALADGVEPEDFHHLALIFHWRDNLPDPTLVERAVDRLAASPRLDPLMADELRAMRARLAVEAGRPAAARELFAGMGGLTRWWVEGPVGIDELADFADLARPPVAAGWRSAAGTDPLGWVRLSGLAWPAQRQMLTLATTVVSDREQPVAIRVGAAQAVRVWLNGREVLTSPRPIERADDQTNGGGWLRPGPNVVVAAVASESDDWWLRVRLTTPDGSALSGVNETTGPPVTVPAVDRVPPEVRDVEGEIRRAVRAGRREAEVALAAYLVLRRPQAVGAGEARSVCRSARAAAPGEARLLEWLMTSDDAIAYELLRDAVDAEPDFGLARLELAAWFGDRGLFDEAAAVLEPLGSEPAARAIALDLDSELWGVVMLPELVDLARRHPTSEAVGLVAAHRAMDAHRIDLARELVAPLVDTAPGAAAVVELRQRLAEACNDGDGLLEIFAEGLDDDPNNTPLRLRLARLFAGIGDVETARERLVVGLDRSPSDVDLLMELARVEHAAGDDGRALELSRRVLELRPQDRRASRLVELISGEAEDLGWLRSVDELKALAADAPAGDPAVTLLDHVEIHFLPSQLIEEKVQQVFLVTAAARAEGFRQRTLPYVAESERLRVLRARVIRRDGSEEAARQSDTPRLAEPEFNLYYDTRLRVLDLPELADGDLIEVAYVRTETIESNETGPYDGGLLSIGRSVPTVLAEIALVGPIDRMPAWELVNLEGEPERIDEGDGRLRLTWSWRDLEAAPHDLPPSPPFARGRFLAFSSHPEWGELASWYARHVAPRVRGSRQIAELAEDLTEGVDDRLERIARIYAHVTNEISYVGLEFGEHRFRPFSADWVLTHGIGDCKDKAALLVALLESVDIPARMVMVRTSDLGPTVGSLALLEVFNHAIAYLPEDDLWLDGTAAGHALLPPPAFDQGATVLVVDGPDSRPRITPVIGAGRSAMTVTLGPAGDAGVPLKLRLEDTGEAADRRRSRFAGSKDPRPFAAWLQGSFPGAELTAEPVRRLVPSSDPAIVELEAVVTRAALDGRGGVATYPGELDLASRVVPTGERSGPLLVEVRPDVEWTLEVDLGRRPADLPEPVTMTSEYGSLRLDVEGRDTGYQVEGYLHLVPGLVPAERAPELRAFLLEVERLLARPLEAP